MSTAMPTTKIAIIPEEKILEIEQKLNQIVTHLSIMVKENPPRSEYTVSEGAFF